MKRYLDRPRWQFPVLLLIAVLGIGCFVGGILAAKPPHDDRLALFVVSALCIGALVLDLTLVLQSWDRRMLSQALGWKSLGTLRFSQRTIPPYRYVDLYRACERFCASHGGEVLEMAANMPLSFIATTAGWRRVAKPLTNKFDVGPAETEWFPTDRFWVLRTAEDGDGNDTILRLRQVHDEYRGSQILLEVGSSGMTAEALLDQLTSDALKHSIYRGHVVRIQTGEGLRDDLGTEVYSNELRLGFCLDKRVEEEDIILDEKIRDILKRNVFTFHQLRERLAQYGIPQRRGLLLFGPPGTGKTYACRYMFTQLEGITALIVTGQALLRLKSVCELARLLQPSLLVLEDVDLVFAEREINPNSTSLGDMLDELDGFESDDAITVVLTTNAIERVERAVKDRPGRISQCVYMAPPNADLRRRYLDRFLRDCDLQQVDLGRVVDETRGASQAFLKEMVFRAIQVSVEREIEANGATLAMKTDDFLTAIDEMKSQTEKAAQSIIGLIGKAAD